MSRKHSSDDAYSNDWPGALDSDSSNARDFSSDRSYSGGSNAWNNVSGSSGGGNSSGGSGSKSQILSNSGGESNGGNGSNRAATIGNPNNTDVTEDAHATGGYLVASGKISISDPDSGQSYYLTAVSAVASPLGSLAIKSDGSYTYTVANSAVQYLGANDVATDSFTITSADGTTKVVSFTIHGANDAAVIGAPTVSAVTEDVSVVSGNLVAEGSIAITDADQGQSSFNTTVSGAAGNLGTLSLAATGSYTYAVANSAVQYLGAGQSKVDSFTVTSQDGTSKTLSFTINGANDAADIGAPTVSAVTEDALATGSYLVASGAIPVSDQDLGQASFLKSVISAPDSLGSLSLKSDGSYTYAVKNSAVQYLGSGDSKTDSFTVTAADGTSKTVSFTISGSNDAAVIGSPSVSTVTENLAVAADGKLTATGSIAVTDVDRDQSAFQTAVTPAAGNLGDLSLQSNGSYVYSVANSAVQYLGAGNTKVDSFTVSSIDGTTKTVSFTIKGANPPAPGVALAHDTGISASDNISANGSLTASGIEPGATVQYSINNGKTWSSSFAAQEGSNTVLVRQTDLAGQISDTTKFSFTVDTTAPTTPRVSIAFVDSGSSKSDAITTATAATLSGKVDANATVTVYDNGAPIATINAGSNGTWTYAAMALGNGAHSFTITQADVAGNVSAHSAASTMTVDTLAPSATINGSIGTNSGALTTIASGDLTKDATLALSGQASDANGVASVQVFDGATLLGAATISGGNWTYTTLALGDGAHSFTAKVADVAGNTSTSAAISATVDTHAPTVTAVTMSDSALIAGETATVSVAFSEKVTSFDNTDVTVENGTLSPLISADGGTTWTATFTPAADIVASSNAVIVGAGYADLAGNAGARTASANYTIDTHVSGSGAIFGGDKNDKLSGGPGNDTIFGGRGNDIIDGGGGNDTIYGGSGDEQIGGGDGDDTIYGDDGNDKIGGGKGNDVIYGGDGNDNIGGDAGDDVIVSGAGNDNLDGGAGTDVAVYGGNYADYKIASDKNNLVKKVEDLRPGSLDGKDDLKNIETLRFADGEYRDGHFYPNVPSTPDLVAASDSGASGTDNLTNVTTPTLSGTAFAGALIKLYDGTTLVGTATADASGNWLVTTMTLATGNHTLTATATDLAGNTSGASGALTITIDIAPPTESISPTIGTDTGATATITSGGLTKDATLMLSGTVSDANGVASVQVYDGSTLLGAATVSAGAWSFTTGVLTDGAHSFTAKATDNAGNVFTGAEVSATVDTIIATPTITAVIDDVGTVQGVVADGALTNDAMPMLTGTADAAAVVTVFDGATVLGSTTADNAGAWTFTPAAALAQGNHQFHVTATDAAGNAAASAGYGVIIDSAYSNQAPSLTGTPATLADGIEDTPYALSAASLLAGYTDADGDALSVSALTAAHATVTLDNGSYTITPEANYNGAVTLSYAVSDGHGGSVAATRIFNLAAVNDAAVIGMPTVSSVTEDVGVTAGRLTARGSISIADVDAGESVFRTAVQGAPGNLGTLVLATNGAYLYSVANSAVQFLGENATRIDTFTTISADGTTKPVSFTIHGANDAATLTGTNTATVREDVTTSASGSLTASDIDAGQSAFQPQAATPGIYGSFTIDAAGTWSYALNSSAANVQALRAGENVSDSFTVKSTDGTPRAFVVTVQGTNDAAVITGTAAATVQEDVTTDASGVLVASDIDAGQSGFQPQTATPGIYGSFTINAEGAWNYALNDGAAKVQALKAGENVTDSFTVKSIDGTPRTFVVTVQGTNDAATITGTAAATVQEDVTAGASGVLVASDIDAGQSGFQPRTATPGIYGSFTINAEGAWNYALNNSAANVQALKAGENVTDSFTVNSTDGTPKDFLVTVQGANDAPALTETPAALNAGTEDIAYTVSAATLLTGYTDVDGDTLSVSGLTATRATVTFNNGTYTITPDANYNGVVTLNYTVSDAQGGNTGAAQSFNLAAVNDAPSALADTLAATAGMTATYAAAQLLANDDDGDPELAQALTIDSVDNGAGGTATLNLDGSVSFTSDPGFTGEARFSYTVSDGALTSAPATVTIFVTSAPNHPPAGTPAALPNGVEDAAYTVSATSLLANYTDADGDPLSMVGLTATHATVSLQGGIYTIIPEANYNGVVTLNYTVSDGRGGNTAATNSFTLAAVNDAPVLTGAPATLADGAEDTPYAVTAAALLQGYTDAEGDTLSLTGLTATNGTLTLSNGVYTITPDANYNGAVTLGYTVVDGNGGSVGATRTLNLAAVNDAPVLTGTPAALADGVEDTAYALSASTLLAGYTDADNDSLSVTGLTASHGTVAFNSGNYTITPDADYNGAVILSYVVTDGRGGSVAATRTLNLAAVNDAAVITGTSTGSVEEAGGKDNAIAGTPIASGQLAATDVDSSAAFAVVGTPAATGHGTYTIDASGVWTYSLDNTDTAVQALNANATLTDSFTVNTDDGTQQVVTITINGANDAPTLTAPAAISYTDTSSQDTFAPVTGTLSANDVDAGATQTFAVMGGSFSSTLADYDWVKPGPYGTLYLNSASGAYQFVADSTAINAIPAGTNAAVGFTLSASDGIGGTDSQVLNVNLYGANDASVISGVTGPLAYTVGQDAVAVAPALALGDADSGYATSAKVVISGGYSGNEVLAIRLPVGSQIAASFDAGSGQWTYQFPSPSINQITTTFAAGELTLSGTATLAEYQSLLDLVTFQTSTIGGRTISFTVYDGTIDPLNPTASVTVDTSNISLESLTTTGFRIPGEAALDGSGGWVSTAGDINGDGFADVIVGAPWADGDGAYTGRTYVIFGKSSAFDPEVPLWSIDGANGFRMIGEGVLAELGFSVSTAADFNGDGLADLVMGQPYGNDRTGATYVVFGEASFSSALDALGTAGLSAVGTSGGLSGFRLLGENAGDQAGQSVSTAGDVNGDGFSDIIIGAPYGGPLGQGAAYVVFGSATALPANLNLADLGTPGGTPGFRILGEGPGDTAGMRVSGAGDINGDGYADVIIGAPFASPNGHYSGASYVVFGKPSGFSEVLLSSLDGVNGFRLPGVAAGDENGYGISAAGDMNGDGFGDFIVSSFLRDANGVDSGAVYVVFGKSSFSSLLDANANLDLSNLGANDGFRIVGGEAGDTAGYAASGVGDVNGDGYDDIIIGAPGAGAEGAGSSYVVLGGETVFPGPLNLGTLGGADGFRLSGVASGDDSGYAVSGAGDINGDGFADLMVSSAHSSPHGLNLAGESYVIFGAKLVVGGETYLGGSDDDSLIGAVDPGTGDPLDQTFIGGRGNDVMYGNGGRDAFSGGAGDDTFHLGVAGLSAIDYIKIDGGSGFDTLVLDGSGVMLDLTAAGAYRLHSIERIDLTGSGDNTVQLDIRDLLSLSESSNTLQVGGNSGDAVDVVVDAPGTTWAQGADQTINGVLYHSYTQGWANLLFEDQVAVNFG